MTNRRLTLKIISIFLLGSLCLLFSVVPPLSLLSLKSITPGLDYKEETVRFFLVLLFVAALPIVQVSLMKLSKRRFRVLEVFLDTYIGCECTFLLIGIIKCAVGKERPDYANRILIKKGQEALEGKRSFPSGHSGMSVAVAFYLVYDSFMLMKTVKGSFAKSIVAYMGVCLPVFLSSFVCISRIFDNKHDVIDVGAGILLGVLVPYLTRRTLSHRSRHETVVQQEQGVCI